MTRSDLCKTFEKPTTLEQIDQKIAEWQKNLGKENIYRRDDHIFFNYVGNPNGLKISDGYCLCPMIEDKPETLSPTELNICMTLIANNNVFLFLSCFFLN